MINSICLGENILTICSCSLQVDVSDPFPILKTLTHISMLADLTVLPANTAEEAGRILENYKIYENKPPDFIQEKQDPSVLQQVKSTIFPFSYRKS
jgi:DNA excision repair protein ERCC-1